MSRPPAPAIWRRCASSPTLIQLSSARFLTTRAQRFENDRKSYFLDCQPDKVPANADLSDADLSGLLEQFDARQLLHVTFGSNLDRFGPQIHGLIADHEEAYERC